MLDEMLEEEVCRVVNEFVVDDETAVQMAKCNLFDKMAEAVKVNEDLEDLLEEILF